MKQLVDFFIGIIYILFIIFLFAFMYTLGGCATLERDTYQRVETGNYYPRCSVSG